MKDIRKNTKEVRIGNKKIGGGNPILIQSMTNTKTEDVHSTIAQIKELEVLGCDIIRCAVPNMEAALAIREIKKNISIPLVADIHFDYRLAIASIEAGADKIRINPGNIGSYEKLKIVVMKAKEFDIPIRVGVNGGSLEKSILNKHGGATSRAIVESAIENVNKIRDMGYDNLVVSIKSSAVLESIEAHKLLAEEIDLPIHVGITEAGSSFNGGIKSGVGIGIILYEGIGDTIRVSMTGEPKDEILAAKIILKSLGLRDGGVEIVSCPTCGRTDIDLIGLEKKVSKLLEEYPDLDLKIAVMGCVVNGPGEAREADLGICGGKERGLIIKKGEIIANLEEDKLLDALRFELNKIILEKSK